jgi:hypothetical protein
LKTAAIAAWALSYLGRQARTAAAKQSFSVLKRPPPNYEGHIPLTTIEQGAMAVSAALGSLWNPYRGGPETGNHIRRLFG